MRSAILGIGLAGLAGLLTACGSSGNTTTDSGGSTGGGSGHSGTGGGGVGGSITTGTGGSSGAIMLGDGGPCATAVTCESQGLNCGPISDGCGGIIQCGDCPSGQTCGGAGVSSVCGAPPCTPKTCGDLGFDCGPAGDGCGQQLDCGSCSGTDTCGGGGAGKCGTTTTCTPKTCADLGFNCGPAGDGCGGQLDCGSCSGTDTCGGGGVASVCGVPPCVAKTCSDFGANTCGPVGDGCGGVIQCGGCNAPETCGGSTAGQCSIPASCTNLCLKQVTCAGGGTTTVSGIVYAPNGVDPLPNVLVYVPNAAVQAFTAGVSCDKCSSGVSGSPLVSVATDTSGKFKLENVPVGTNIPLVIQTGRWRRQVTLPSVTACVDNPAAATLTRLPRTKAEGDIPHMAMVTGSVDALECVLRKIGVDDSEFTKSTGTGRIHLYVGDGTAEGYHLGGANAGTGTATETTLVNTPATLAQYDMLLLACKGAEYDRTATQLTNVVNYANSGGRVFATHFSYAYLFNKAPFSSTAEWDVNQCDPFTSPDGCFNYQGYPADQAGIIDTTFPKGLALAQWLVNIGATPTLGQIPINTLRWDLDGVVAPAQEWMKIHDPNIGDVPMHYTFNTPVAAAADAQCGRVLFDDFHVENHGYIDQDSAYGLTFPTECAGGAMTPQEKLLEFMIFDLGSCVTPDVPSCTKTTCAAQGIGCGPAGDGCGGALDCGTCTAPQTCGGGGMPSVCGQTTCTPKTCSTLGVHCGPAGDGCGGSLDCGSCPAGQTCGGGGTPGVCGTGTCTAKTCAGQNISCGPAGDGCGHALDCGTCPTGQTCGGGGVSGMCGSACTPKTCAQLGFDCGAAGDGCGGQLSCGTCSAPNTCGGGGKSNVCGGSIPH